MAIPALGEYLVYGSDSLKNTTGYLFTRGVVEILSGIPVLGQILAMALQKNSMSPSLSLAQTVYGLRDWLVLSKLEYYLERA